MQGALGLKELGLELRLRGTFKERVQEKPFGNVRLQTIAVAVDPKPSWSPSTSWARETRASAS